MYLANHLVQFLKKDTFGVLSLESLAVRLYPIPSTLESLSSTVSVSYTSECSSISSLTGVNADVSEKKLDPVVPEFPVIDEIISIVVEKCPIDANKNNMEVFRNEVIDCISDKIFEKFEEKTNVDQSTIRKAEFKDLTKEIFLSLLDSGLFYFNVNPFLHHDKMKNVSQVKSRQRRHDKVQIHESKVPKDLPSSADKPNLDNITSSDVPGPSKLVCNYQENEKIKCRKNCNSLKICNTDEESKSKSCIKNQRDFTDSALMVSSSLSDLLVSVLRLVELSEIIFMLQLPTLKPSLTVNAPNLCHTRKDIMQMVITVSRFCYFRMIF